MLMKRLLSRILPVSSDNQAPRSTPMMEGVEGRLLLAAGPRVKEIFADNRGQFTITMDRAIKGNTVNKNSVQVFQVARDGTETKKDIQVGYAKKQRQIVGRANMKANAVYKIRLVSSRIQGLDGAKLDGEFRAGKISGNGEEGGDYLVKTKRSSKVVARYYTSMGIMDVRLTPDKTPVTVQNFLKYANGKRWDGTYFHRSTDLQTDGLAVIQGGGFYIRDGSVDIPVKSDPAIINEPTLPKPRNTVGTLAMARTGEVNSATSQWYFNVSDNSQALDDQNGGFTVFGKITNEAGLRVMRAINGLPTVDVFPNTQDAFGEVPSDDGAAVVVNRLAIRMDVVSGRTNKSAVEPANVITQSFSIDPSAVAFSAKVVESDSVLASDDAVL